MLHFITSNKFKVQRIVPTLAELGIQITVKELELLEVQSDSIEEIAAHKAKEAFKKLGEPLIVVDDGWFIKALRGFPGAYMKFINEWFTSEDFLRLMQGKTDRDVVFIQALCYIDAKGIKTFTYTATGQVLTKARGSTYPSNNVISLSNDGVSLSEKVASNSRTIDDMAMWQEFADWLKENRKI